MLNLVTALFLAVIPDAVLQNWVLTQQQQYQLHFICPEHKKLLDDIYFVWRVDVYNAKSTLHQ